MGSTYEEKLKQFGIDLFKINAVKFGDYKTKVGLRTPVYMDLRIIVSYPKLLDTLADLIIEYLAKVNKFDIVCGVPYTALPIATVVSVKTNIPMVMRRKEAKDYGTKKLIEGQFNEGDNCLIIEDVVTSGSSILETVNDLKNSGIVCKDAVVLLNREQGGNELLRTNNIKMHALLNLTQLMEILKDANCVNEKTVQEVKDYLANTKVDASVLAKPKQNRLQLTYGERAKLAKNPIAVQLFEIMSTKQTNLCVAADLTKTTDLLNLAEQVGPHICLFKTHIDIVDDFHPNFLKHLRDIAKNHNFILFEDKKFADIGKTVQLQYSESIYKISSWASVVTAHSLMGKGVLDAIKESKGLNERGVFLLAEASAAGNLIDGNYTKATIKLAGDYSDLITGIVCQSPLFLNQPGLIQLTPGVQLDFIQDTLSQQYNTPDYVVLNKGADIAVVGRGITKFGDPAAEALKYKELLWAAYQKRISL